MNGQKACKRIADMLQMKLLNTVDDGGGWFTCHVEPDIEDMSDELTDLLEKTVEKASDDWRLVSLNTDRIEFTIDTS